MKTAKSICEAIKLQEQQQKDANINFIIDKVETSSGTYKVSNYRMSQMGVGFDVTTRHPVSSAEYLHVTTILDKERSRLEELGFKITKSYEDIEYATHDSKYQDIPDFKIFGVVLKKAYSKHVGSEDVLKKVSVNVITISACCGEE